MNLIERVEDIIGDQDSSSDTQILQHLSDAAKEVYSALPLKVKQRLADKTEQDSATGSNVENKEIINAERAGYSVKEVGIGRKTQVVDTNSIYFATKRSPVYYIDDKKIVIKPAPTAQEKAVIYLVAYPSIDSNAASITGIPTTATQAVVISAAIKFLNFKMNIHVQEDEDSELAQATSLQIQSLQAVLANELQRLQTLS